MKSSCSILWASFLCCSIPSALAAPALFPGNGHHYDFIPGSFTWDAARADAATRTYLGVSGHLATVTTAAEDSFIRATFSAQVSQYVGPWLGAQWSGSGSGPTAGWSWVTGEPFVYTGWNGGEPNHLGGEDALHFSGGGWNDIRRELTDAIGYFVEFDTTLCPVGPLTTQHMNEPPYDESYLAIELREALSCFRDAVAALGGSMTPTSGYRPTEYQAHLYELRTNFVELSQLNGIVAYLDGRRPQLATTPGTAACQSVVDAVNAEIRQHLLVARTDGTPAVSAPGNSLHELGRAVDLTVGGLPANVSADRLARNCGLYRPYVANDPVHYELTGETPRRQLTFTGHSPINILVVDPVGRKIGFDANLGTAVNQIGAYATYTGAGSSPQVVQILPNEVRAGEYAVSGVGTGDGPYTVRVQILSEDGAGTVIDRVLVTGVAEAGQPVHPIPPIDCLLNSVSLQVERLGDNLLLFAPPYATNFVVEASRSLLSNSWTEIATSINPTNGLVITNLGEGASFFRLRTR